MSENLLGFSAHQDQGTLYWAPLLLPAEGFQLAVEFAQQARGLRVLGDGFLRLLELGDGGVLGDQIAQLLGGLNDLGFFNGHVGPLETGYYSRAAVRVETRGFA